MEPWICARQPRSRRTDAYKRNLVHALSHVKANGDDRVFKARIFSLGAVLSMGKFTLDELKSNLVFLFELCMAQHWNRH